MGDEDRSGRGCRALKDVAAFYQRKQTNDDIAAFYEKSVHLPTKRTVPVKKESQRKVLDMNMRNLHQLYSKVRPYQRVSFSAFCKHRPRHVLSFTKTPLRQCMCEVCINPMLKMKERSSGGRYAMACLERRCADCGVGNTKKK